jgi:TolB-like protein
MSADADNEFFSDGLTEELITDLSGVTALRGLPEFDRIVEKAARRVAEFSA